MLLFTVLKNCAFKVYHYLVFFLMEKQARHFPIHIVDFTSFFTSFSHAFSVYTEFFIHFFHSQVNELK